MSITRVYSVFCDVQSEHCHSWISQTVEGAAAARREAKRNGWKRENGADVCPGCHSGASIPSRSFA